MTWKANFRGTEQEYSGNIETESIDELMDEIKRKIKNISNYQFINIKVERK